MLTRRAFLALSAATAGAYLILRPHPVPQPSSEEIDVAIAEYRARRPWHPITRAEVERLPWQSS